ncbi:REP-associated tyrosine transposase [Legionella fallonii]|uniref:Transposase IS200-like n=1 Tax=Legionella fallonii LLAP-10 TaxID=1212491 RepID=A0A098G0T4_9GAMM|nr:transposase [Legionella fallonii]CEG55571.1 Transposase IS200-like [Legionella fallonii LLAP-10]
MHYRRDYTPGATYFFTVVTFGRRKLFNHPDKIAQLRLAFSDEMARRPFHIDAIVIMPDHLHTIWTLPTDDLDYSIRWRNIKRSFTTTVPQEQRPVVLGSRQRKNEQAIWQRRFWEHRIRDENDFNQHVDYIHYNPVKHGVALRPVDWPYSSIHRYIRNELISPDWGSNPINLSDKIGHE